MAFNKIKKLLLGMFLLVMIPGVLAMSITPTTPVTNDALTCNIAQAAQHVFRWDDNGRFVFEGQTLPASYTTKAHSYTCKAYIDLFGSLVMEDLISVTVVNSPPVITAINFAGTPYYANSVITANVVASDPDGDALTYNYIFSNGTTTLQNSSANTYACSVASCRKGTVINVTAVATDTENALSNTFSNTVTIQNSVPTALAITYLPATAYSNSTLNISATATDVDGDALTYTYQFTDSVLGLLRNYSANNLYALNSSNAHNFILAEVNVTDGTGSINSSANITVANYLPLFSLANQSFNQDTNLTVNLTTLTSDIDGDSVSFLITDPANLTTYINGDNVTIEPDAGFVGTQGIDFTMDDGYSNSTKTVYFTILDTIAPALTIAAPTNGQVFNATNNVTLNFTAADNVAVSACRYVADFGSGSLNCTSGTQDFSDLNNGNHSLTVYVNDSQGNVNSTSVNFTVAYNTVPQTTYMNFTPVAPKTADNLNLTFKFSDREDASINYTYNLYIDGAYNLSGSSSVANNTFGSVIFNNTLTTKDQNWTVELYPSDGLLNGTAQNMSLVILNTAPVISTIPTQTWNMDANKTINLSSYFTDADADDLNFTSTSPANITVVINNATDSVTLVPDTGFIGTRTITFTAYDDDLANVTSNSITLNVGLSTVLNSYVNNTLYNGMYSNITGIVTSTLNNSNVTGPTITVNNSNLQNATIVNSTVDNCTILNSYLLNTPCLNQYIDPSDVRRSNITGTNVYDSIIWDSNATYSTVNNTDIYNSSITLSNMAESTLTNVTMSGSSISGSTLSNTTIADANVTNNVLYSGTMLMSNGSVYNATSSGSQNLNQLLNSDPSAVISAPANGASYNTDTSINFTSGSTDVNIGTLLNDSLTYLWLFGDGITATTENATHSYSSAGSKTVTLTVTDSFNKTSATTIELTITAPSSGGSTGGHSSSGSSSPLSIFTIALTNNEMKAMKVGDQTKFSFAGKTHTVTLENIYNSFVKVQVESTPVYSFISEGSSQKFDLNADGYYDLDLRVMNITSDKSKATLKFSPLFEEIPKQIVAQETNKTVEVNKTVKETDEADTNQNEETEAKIGFMTSVKSFFGKVWNWITSTYDSAVGNVSDNALIYGSIAGAAIAVALISWIVMLTLKLRKLSKKLARRK